MSFISRKSALAVVSVFALVAFAAPAVHADPIIKDAKGKFELKKKDPKQQTVSLKKAVKGKSKAEKLNKDPGKAKVRKAVKFDLDKKFDPKKKKLGDKKLKKLTASATTDKFKLPGASGGSGKIKQKVKKNKKVKFAKISRSTTGQIKKSDPKKASFQVPMQLVLNVTRSGLISGFSLDWLSGKPVPSSDAKDLAMSGFTVRVAEPTTILLLAAGLFGLGCVGIRRKSAA